MTEYLQYQPQTVTGCDCHTISWSLTAYQNHIIVSINQGNVMMFRVTIGEHHGVPLDSFWLDMCYGSSHTIWLFTSEDVLNVIYFIPAFQFFFSVRFFLGRRWSVWRRAGRWAAATWCTARRRRRARRSSPSSSSSKRWPSANRKVLRPFFFCFFWFFFRLGSPLFVEWRAAFVKRFVDNQRTSVSFLLFSVWNSIV